MNGSKEKDYDFIYTLVVLGNINTGKRIVHAKICHMENESWLGDFVVLNKQLETGERLKLRLSLETGGERWTHRCISDRKFATYQGIFLVYNYCLRKTFDILNDWLDAIKKRGPEDSIIMIVGNKYVHSNMTDEREVTFEEGHKFAYQNGLSFMEITDHNQQTLVDEKFMDLVCNVHEKQKDKPIVEKQRTQETLSSNRTKCTII
eukprot:TCONS_00060363-protein